MSIASIGPARSWFGMAALAFSMAAQADTTLNAVGAGWFTHAGEHILGNDNYAVGGGLDGYVRNNFFVFDLTGITGPITSATLRIYNPNMPASPGFPYGYTSADATETYTVFDVSTLPSNLMAGYGVGSLVGQGIYNDLGSGQSFGSYTASLADNGHYVEIGLNAAGLAALNASGGVFAVGGAITTLDAVVNKESLFASAFLSSVGPNQPHLVITSVPEPESYLLFSAGLGLLGLAARRRATSSRLHASQPRRKMDGEQ